jgi:hypothetical protein
MNTGNIKKLMFLWSKVRPVRGADNLTAIFDIHCGILNIPQPYRSPRPVTGIALLFLLYISVKLNLKHIVSIVLMSGRVVFSFTSDVDVTPDTAFVCLFVCSP